jgi:hypothetical protein
MALPTLLLAGCSGDDDDTSSEPAPNEAADESGDGESGGGDTGGDAPDLGDVPIPAPPGSVAALTTDTGEIKVYSLTFDAGDLDAVIAFYDEWTSSQSDEYQRTDAGAGGVSWVRTSGPADQGRIISVLAPLEGDSIGLATLTDGFTG